jgi:wyosine [tRNA(Phe)-imidazoG37] synthetase (radical SAM superfamily)
MSAKASKKKPEASEGPKRRSLFDHVKHIRQVQDPNYYVNLSEDDGKTFTHYMILRALSMDEAIVEDMAELYKILDKVPSAQFYQLLIALIPKNLKFYPWVKTRNMKHNKKLLELVAQRFKVPEYQAKDYCSLLILTEEGRIELVNICKTFGLEDREVEELFEEPDHEKIPS